MQALVLTSPGCFSYEDRPLPVRHEGEALLQVKAVSICGSDLHALAGSMPLFTYPRVIGHEIAGVVTEADGRPGGLQPGDRVCVMPVISCGRCIACAKGKTNCCTGLRIRGVQVDGGLQEYMAVPETSLLKTPDNYDFDAISLVEPYTIGIHAISRIRINEGDRALILGAGPIGVCCAIAAQVRGASVTLADISQERAGFVRERFGFPVLDARSGGYEEELRRITEDRLFHLVVDTTANKHSMEQAYTRIGNGGQILFVGMYAGKLELDEAAFHAKEPTLAVTRNSTAADFAEVMRLWADGVIDPGRLQTHGAPFASAADAILEWAAAKDQVFKGVVRMYNG